MAEYSLGLDFGSLSVRALIVNMETGEECGTAVCEYSHGILEDQLPDGSEVPRGFVLQLPSDYWNGMGTCVRKAIKNAGVTPEEIKGIGICTTASTVLPVRKDGTPLCELDEYKSNPHAYMKMWKHRGAIEIAGRMKEVAERRKEKWFEEYGGVITCEWLVPKVLELAMNASEIYEAAAHVIEVGDWLVYRLTGVNSRSIALARCNGLMRETERPSKEFFSEICPTASDVINDKLSGIYQPIGSTAGYLNENAAAFLGLKRGTPVGPAIVDAQATVLASGANKCGDMAMIVGTSAVEILLSDKPKSIKGIHISAQDAAVPGLYSLGGGQSCVGDGFEWYINNCVPPKVWEAAKKHNQSVHEYLMKQAEKLQPGSSGLLALDWWNGLRSPSFRFDLSGCIMGLTLHTRSEEIYRCMLEASVFGARRVIEILIAAGCQVHRIFAGGGIAQKNRLMMKIYADVMQSEINICKSSQTGALGAAMLGALAAGCYKEDVLKRMSSDILVQYKPDEEAGKKYDKVYREYMRTAEWFEHVGSPMDMLDAK